MLSFRAAHGTSSQTHTMNFTFKVLGVTVIDIVSFWLAFFWKYKIINYSRQKPQQGIYYVNLNGK